jgi:hypothetical protein
MVEVVQSSVARRVIRGSRQKALLLLLGCCTFVVWGMTSPQSASDHNLPMFAAVFFGPGVPIFIAQIIWPEVLILDPEGFTSRMLWRTQSQKWSDIEEFLLWSPARGSQMVGYNFKPDRRPRGWLTQINRSLACDASFPGGWKMSPQELLTTLQDWKARYG